MIKALIRQMLIIPKAFPLAHGRLTLCPHFFWSVKKQHSISAALKDKIGPIQASIAVVGQQKVQVHHTTECLSITDMQSAETASEEFLLLRITCSNCKNRSTRAFLRNAYDNGVVMVRCSSCQHYHLISDHFGWFASEIAESTPAKPYDSVAIIRFIRSALDKVISKEEK